eukprot:scaffold215768_cov31-Tisochrysis_lutea.AAC.5
MDAVCVERLMRPPAIARNLELTQRANEGDDAAIWSDCRLELNLPDRKPAAVQIPHCEVSAEWADRYGRLNRRDHDGHIAHHRVDEGVIVCLEPPADCSPACTSHRARAQRQQEGDREHRGRR